ncbi:PTS glucose transporter subunit IIA [Proteiniborus sp. MB09-C3]|uniref:PTS sugar transporter subunit IIA n=1 Tax=Proteiniborus sp. MB09-C3 TaxID=3050072 RepID=UPI0025550470|nr:PTS glucose transporter subunit IIA [Proteiniborus sp. MB09-C3]WIV12789.1 PTS glucose transporter subunit IIA [Proteiniborus sp. MB09-C3]
MLNFLKRKREISMAAPMTGEIIEIDKVPDAVFAGKMIGDGLAIKPSEGTVVAPCNGKIIQVFPTNHAIGILTPEGIELLIHIGLDTVNLKGNGFKVFVAAGDDVKKGDKLLEVDLEYVSNNAKSTISPIIITNIDMIHSLSVKKGTVEEGKDAIMDIQLK